MIFVRLRVDTVFTCMIPLSIFRPRSVAAAHSAIVVRCDEKQELWKAPCFMPLLSWCFKSRETITLIYRL